MNTASLALSANSQTQEPTTRYDSFAVQARAGDGGDAAGDCPGGSHDRPRHPGSHQGRVAGAGECFLLCIERHAVTAVLADQSWHAWRASARQRTRLPSLTASSPPLCSAPQFKYAANLRVDKLASDPQAMRGSLDPQV